MLLFVIFVSISAAAATSPLKPDSDTVIKSSSSKSSYSSTSSSSSSSTNSSSITSCGIGAKCPNRCRPTCTVPNPKNCNEYRKCTYCPKGNIWNEDDKKCVPIDECPYGQGCNGDPNAGIRERPPPCPSTCERPEEYPCEKVGLAVGCICNAGYIKNKNGTCIDVDSCPGGNPCGVNGTFAYCKVDCPINYCPVDDNDGQVVCDPARLCPSGCVCKYRYSWKSEEDKTCILSQECPAIPCTRPNEAWDPCPSICYSDSCENYNKPHNICYTLVQPACSPRCQCKKGFARQQETSTCIRGEDCPKHETQPVEPNLPVSES